MNAKVRVTILLTSLDMDEIYSYMYCHNWKKKEKKNTSGREDFK